MKDIIKYFNLLTGKCRRRPAADEAAARARRAEAGAGAQGVDDGAQGGGKAGREGSGGEEGDCHCRRRSSDHQQRQGGYSHTRQDGRVCRYG